MQRTDNPFKINGADIQTKAPESEHNAGPIAMSDWRMN